MAIAFTPEQRRAIDTRGADMLVSAGAGSGKTAVLVERVLELISGEKGHTDVDRLLVVTFTKAAAAEMRLKIQDALLTRAQEGGGAAVHRQLTLLPKASICTIHAFCADVVRANFHLADVDPRFSVADEAEAEVLLSAALNETMEQMYEDEVFGEAFYGLLDYFGGGRDDARLAEIVLDIYRFSQSMPDPEGWLEAACENFRSDAPGGLLDKPFGQYLRAYLCELVFACVAGYDAALERIEGSEGLAGYWETFCGERDMLRRLHEVLGGGSFDEIADAARAVRFDRLKPCARGFASEAEEVKRIRSAVKQEISDLMDTVLNVSELQAQEELQAIYPAMQCLAHTVRRLMQSYALQKQEKALLDFNDLEHVSIRLLTERGSDGVVRPTKTALELRDRYDYILIDEYQDSNFVQEAIFQSIKREDNLFLVGDVKQSIYRFRNAMPELFLEKYRAWPESEGEKRLKIRLYRNFRSRDAVLDFVNGVFANAMSRFVGETDYTEEEFLNCGAPYRETGGDYRVEAIVVKRESGAGQDGDEPGADAGPASSAEAQAMFAARRIRELVYEEKLPVLDRELGEYRPVSFGDIVILLRATKQKAEVFYSVLSAYGVPVFSDQASGFFDAPEIRVMLALLRVIDNPKSDIDLLAVLRSPLFSFGENELLEIRLQNRGLPFYDALKEAAVQSDRAQNFLATLDRWRKMALDTSVDRLIYQIYEESGYLSYVGGLKNGAARAANLQSLFVRAQQFEKSSFKGLFYFNQYLLHMNENEQDFSGGRDPSENRDAVRIMSIHKSKGLEFPVVIVADCDKRFNRNDLRKPVLLHHALGMAPDFVDTEVRVSYTTVMKETLRRKLQLESLSEEMRVLYVAMTRAKEKLIFLGCVRNAEKTLARWEDAAAYAPLPQLDALHSGCYFDWIGPYLKKATCGAVLRVCDAGEAAELSFEDYVETERKIGGFEAWDLQDVPSEEMRRRFSYVYPHLSAGAMQAKYSVTELYKLLFQDEAEWDLQSLHMIEEPDFLRAQHGLDAGRRGTALHTAMQHMDLLDVSDEERVRRQICAMANGGVLTAEEAQAVDAAKICRFFESDLGRRMRRAEQVYREQRFFFRVPAREVRPDAPEGELVMVQGVIDCYFEEESGIVLVDYKTDRADSDDYFRSRYAMQLALYASAVGAILHRPVREKLIYSFHLERAIKI